MQKQVKMKEDKLQEMRRLKEEEEARQLSFRPAINAKSRQLMRGIPKSRIDGCRTSTRANLTSTSDNNTVYEGWGADEMKDRPTINSRSARLDTSDSLPVHERLHHGATKSPRRSGPQVVVYTDTHRDIYEQLWGSRGAN